MPIPTQHRVYCVKCKEYIETIRLGDQIDTKEFSIIRNSLCKKCKGSFWKRMLAKEEI